MTTIKNKLPRRYANDIQHYDIVKRKKFYGFDNYKEHSFIRVLFSNTRTLHKCKKILDEEIKITGMKKQKYDIFESNIPPLLRFIHIQDIKSAGWIKLSADKYKPSNYSQSNTQLEIEIDWKDVIPIEKNSFAPFLIASFDIEADSSHGDFPLPKKTYTKLCREIHYNIGKVKNKKIVKDKIAEYLEEAFTDNPQNVSKIFSKYNRKPTDIQIEIAAKKIEEIYNRKENYKILANDIIINKMKKHKILLKMLFVIK